MSIANSLLDWSWWSFALVEYVFHPFITVILCLLSVFVVLGNLLVVSAIWHENQMHSVTNYLIASLAAADCLVGAVVMPFSIISEIIVGSWTFSATWCDLWHSFDVLASTASIMNLCAISWDRYLAITDPINYPTKMTPKIVALHIVSLWISSALISFPAIFWWRAVSQGPLQPFTLVPTIEETISSIDSPSTTSVGFPARSDEQEKSSQLLFKCVFTDDPYYLLFSSTISFYGPLCVMLYAYYRIYKAAVKQTRFLKYGSKQVVVGGKGKKSKRFRHYSEHSVQPGSSEKDGFNELYADAESSDAAQHLVLRAHRGGFQPEKSNNSTRSRRDGDGSSQKDLFVNQMGDSESGFSKSSQLLEDFAQSDARNSRSQSGKLTDTMKIRDLIRRTDQVSLRNSRRDRIKVDCQRFDARPVQDDVQKPSRMAYATDSAETGDSVVPRSEKATSEENSKPKYKSAIEKFVGVDVDGRVNRHLPRELISHRHKNLWSSTTSHGQEVSPTIQARPNHSDSRSGFNQANYSFETLSMKERSINLLGEDGSITTSSGSYGTGSIASVRARTILEEENNSTEKLGANICDNDASIPEDCSQAKDTKGTWYRESKSMIEMNEAAKVPIAPKPGSGKYRASCGDQSFKSDVFFNLRTAKTLNIRAWAKLGQSKRSDKETLDAKDRIDPPRSLLPLIMMNSDTSTDSSVSGVYDSKPNKRPKDHDRLTKDKDISFEIASTFVDSQHHTSVNSSNLEGRENDDQLLVGKQGERKISKDISSEKNDSSTKAQVLYYESNKLVQSIVDLSTIRYIDCTNDGQSGREISSELHDRSANQDTNYEERQTLQAGQTQGSLAVNFPQHQNRKVGKKLTKLAKERKAAKTLGIVVGVFVLCWLPFFVMNIIVALCGAHCVYKFHITGQIVTWLGWLNSAMNPVIYACWSRDFRRAFRRVLCAWVEFICPYDGANIARKLKLKKSLNYSPQDVLGSNKTMVSSVRAKSSSVPSRKNPSPDRREQSPSHSHTNGELSRNFLSSTDH